MSAMEKMLGITISAKNSADGASKALEVCREISVKSTTLYPEENCGQPETLVVCEEVTQEGAETPSKTWRPGTRT